LSGFSNWSRRVLSPERFVLLQADWVRLLNQYSVAPPDAYPLFDRLVAAYAEPHRHYHTLEHLSEMFRVSGRLTDFATDPSAVKLAIWFHDAVYDPQAHDNEERSATLAGEALRSLHIPEPIQIHVAAMIRATAHATSTEMDGDTNVLLDADLAILSAEERRYDRYAADIRREYAWVEERAYRVGRTKVLEAFLNRPRLYRTGRMHEVAEQLARQNLKREINQLTADG
jgi:predicted metal-dependent HD superfamily phosphohydrolase